jgi:hypothetical protein
MKTHTTLPLRLCIAALVFLWSCQEEEVTAVADDEEDQEETFDLSMYSGTWEGQRRLVKIGDCFIYEGWFLNVWDMVVEANGTITISEERFFDPYSSSWYPAGGSWTGQILQDNTVSLEKTYTITCDGIETDGSATLTGTISKNEDTLTLSLEGTEVWCPTMNCVFRSQYQMQTTL